jgi:hypothetical protein
MFGTITFLYEPSTDKFDSEDPSDPRVSMQFSSEANLSEMTENFERFLRAIGYPLDYDEFLAVTSCGEPREECETTEKNSFYFQYPEIKIHGDDPSSSLASNIAKAVNKSIEAFTISQEAS